MKSTSSVYDCHIIEFNKIHNRSGNITAIENEIDIPFSIKRVFYLYDVPGGAERGGHAHKELHQFVVATSGCFDVVLSDGRNRKVIQLNRPYYGLHIVPGIWSEILNFSSGAICLVLASFKYVEEDYIRNFTDFLRYKQND